MKENINNISKDNNAVNQWYKSAISTAVVGMIFSFIILVLLLGNFIHSTIVEARQEQELVDLKIEIQNKPGDEELFEKVRQRDLEFRQNIINRMDFNRKGGYLLLCSVTIMLIGFKSASTIKKKMPAPQPGFDRLKEQISDAKFSRWAVTTGLVILGLATSILVIKPGVVFYEVSPASVSYPTEEEVAANWPTFRGPQGLGISAYTNIPTNWNGETGEGILWKSEVPLPGMNSPVVWGDRVFISGGDPNQLQVFCYDANTGSLLWTGDVKQIFSESEEEPFDVMEDTGFAAPTVATDGQRVYAIFITGIVACFDFEGNKVWEKDLGIPNSMYGYASSLAMYRNLLLIQFDQGDAEDEKSMMIALDGSTGRIAWQTKRPVPNSWTSPIVAKVNDEFQLITCGDPWVIGYNPADGKELWRADCLGTDVAPSPIYSNGLVFAIQPYSKLIAIRPDGRGDVTETHIEWNISENAPDIGSPVSNGELVFLLTMDGYLSCFKNSDGTKLWEQEVDDYFLASPSFVGDKLYLLGDDGVMFIAEVEPEYKELAKCELGEKCQASPAFADGRIYIRGEKHLFCIGE
jgi:outer membrane protein assembly factor BamB